jgi:hypothetical protein
MKLSHAASRLRTAIAELRRAIGVGSGALLGVMVKIIQNLVNEEASDLRSAAVDCNRGFRGTARSPSRHKANRSLAPSSGACTMRNRNVQCADVYKSLALNPRLAKIYRNNSKLNKAIWTLGRMLKIGILFCLILPLSYRIIPPQTDTAKALEAIICYLLSTALCILESCLPILTELLFGAYPYNDTRMTPNVES